MLFLLHFDGFLYLDYEKIVAIPKYLWQIRLNRPAAMQQLCQITLTTSWY